MHGGDTVTVLAIVIVVPGVALWMRAAYLVETYARQLRQALATARRAAEHAAADPAPLGTPPLRLVHIDEARERLISASVLRHPASDQTSPGCGQGISAPARSLTSAAPGAEPIKP